MVAVLMVILVFYQFGDSLQIIFANALRGVADVTSMAVISFIGYIIAGFVHIWWVVLGISLILLLLTLTVIKKITSSKEEETKASA